MSRAIMGPLCLLNIYSCEFQLVGHYMSNNRLHTGIEINYFR